MNHYQEHKLLNLKIKKQKLVKFKIYQKERIQLEEYFNNQNKINKLMKNKKVEIIVLKKINKCIRRM
jgi:hypothetical protein